MKPLLPLFCVALALSGGLLAGCDNTGQVIDEPMEGRKERKPWEEMTKEEKIEMIERTPMSDEAKRKQIDQIRAGTL